jgi:heme/copper-type cytochrome/quinol oxidase subunit 3
MADLTANDVVAPDAASGELSIGVPPLEARGSGRSLGWWGAVWLIATEGMLFALLLFGNFYLRAYNRHWPMGGIEDPELAKSGVRTIVLLSSTIPVVVAERAAKRGQRGLAAAGLVLTILMGSAFLAGHVDEYLTLWPELRPSTNAYGSVFYTITALHALHVLIGIMVLGFLLWRLLAGHYGAGHSEPIEVGTLYWHFVDVVWVFVFSSLYLSVTLL